jgi:alkylation response protein AidB-like acyl-CoA dehydrogenase
MPGGLSEEQAALRAAVRDLLARHSGSAAVRAAVESPAGHDRALWKRLAGEIGVAALAVPEEYGGAGASLLESCVVLEELGRTLTPSPLLGSILAGEALLAGGDGDACRRLLPGIAAGNRLAALAWVGRAGGWDPDAPACRAALHGGSWSLDGEAHHVLDGDLADVLLVAARTGGGVGLFEVDPRQAEVARVHTPAMDPTRRLALVRLAGATGRPLVAGDAARAVLGRLRDVACVALSAEQVGGAPRRWSARSSTARSGCSSAGRSAASRRSSTGWPTCTCWSRPPGRRRTRRRLQRRQGGRRPARRTCRCSPHARRCTARRPSRAWPAR